MRTHGTDNPKCLRCPEGVTRKSIALYYFTEEEDKPVKRVTQYRARPEDGFKRVLIRLDQWALEAYSRTKSALGLNDDFVSKLLGGLGKKHSQGPGRNEDTSTSGSRSSAVVPPEDLPIDKHESP